MYVVTLHVNSIPLICFLPFFSAYDKELKVIYAYKLWLWIITIAGTAYNISELSQWTAVQLVFYCFTAGETYCFHLY